MSTQVPQVTNDWGA